MSAGLEREADWEASILAWLHRQLFVKPPAPPTSVRLTNKAAIITGSNVGLGFECSRQLLKMDLSHLVLAVRSESKGNGAASHLQSEFPELKLRFGSLIWSGTIPSSGLLGAAKAFRKSIS